MQRMMKQSALGLLASVFALPVLAAPIDLNDWSAESYDSVSGFPDGNWAVSGDGSNVLQQNNGQPTLFYSDFDAFGTEVTGRIKVNTSGDDDFIGFVLGYQPGDNTSTSANYLLVDWKGNSQDFDFGGGSTSPGGNAPEGLAASRVTGLPDADEFWQHDNLSGTPETSALEELARGATLGNTGWTTGTEYEFSFDFGPNNLDVYVDSTLEMSINGSFANGRIGFYNFSQSQVNYSAFEVEEGSFPDEPVSVPEPAGLALLFGGLMALWGRRRLAA